MDALYILVLIAMGAVVLILAIGIGGYAKGGKFNQKYGNKMMQLRIVAQAIAIALILLFIWLRSKGA